MFSKGADQPSQEHPVLLKVFVIAKFDSMWDGDGNKVDAVSRGELVWLFCHRVDQGSKEEVRPELVPLVVLVLHVEGGKQVETLQDICRKIPPGPAFLTKPVAGALFPPVPCHGSRESRLVDKPLGVFEELSVDGSVLRRLLLRALPVPFYAVEENLLCRALRLDLCAAREELSDVLEPLRRILDEAFEVFYPSSGDRWFLTASLGAAGERKEVVARVDREVDQVSHHFRNLLKTKENCRYS